MELWQLLLVIFTGIIAISSLVLLGGIAFLAFAVRNLVNRSVQPAICEATETIRNVNGFVERVEQKAECILDISEETARRVSGSVVSTTDMVQHTVAQPIINLASLMAGISKAISTLRRTA